MAPVTVDVQLLGMQERIEVSVGQVHQYQETIFSLVVMPWSWTDLDGFCGQYLLLVAVVIAV